MFKSLQSAEEHVDRLLKVAGNHNYFLCSISIFVYYVFLTASVENEESDSLEGLNNGIFETLPTLSAEVVRSSTEKEFGEPSGSQDAKVEVMQSSSNQPFKKPGECRVTTVEVIKSSSDKGQNFEILVSASTVFL